MGGVSGGSAGVGEMGGGGKWKETHSRTSVSSLVRAGSAAASEVAPASAKSFSRL